MGMYDSIGVPCPKCGELYYAQTKSGACDLLEWELKDAPKDALEDVNRHAPFECDCGAIFEVSTENIPVECEKRERVDHLGIKNIISSNPF